MALVFYDGFESGDFSKWSGTNGTVSVVSSPVLTGQYAAQITLNQGYLNLTGPLGTTQVFVGAFDFYYSTLPTDDAPLLSMDTAGGADKLYIFYNGSAAGNIKVFLAGASVDSGFHPLINTWYRIYFRVDTSTSTYKLDWNVNGSDITQATSGGQSASNITSIKLGSDIVRSGVAVFDNFIGSVTSGDYELGTYVTNDSATLSSSSLVFIPITTTDSSALSDSSQLSVPRITTEALVLSESSVLSALPADQPAAEGPLTINSLVNEVLDVVHGYVRTQEARTHLTADMLKTDLTFMVADPRRISTGLVEIDDEVMYVSQVDKTSGMVTVEPWGRGQSETQAVSHAANARVTDNPVIPRQRVRNTIWGTLREMFPDVFAFGEVFLDANPVLTHYDLPADAYHVMQVQWQLPGPTHLWTEAQRWKQNKRAGGPIELELFTRAWPGSQRIRVQYVKVAPDEFGSFDDLGGYGYDLQVRDVIVLGAAAKIMAFVEPARVLTESLVSTGRAEVVPAGSATQISKYLYQLFQKRLDDERQQQLFRHPLQMHFTR